MKRLALLLCLLLSVAGCSSGNQPGYGIGLEELYASEDPYILGLLEEADSLELDQKVTFHNISFDIPSSWYVTRDTEEHLVFSNVELYAMGVDLPGGPHILYIDKFDGLQTDKNINSSKDIRNLLEEFKAEREEEEDLTLGDTFSFRTSSDQLPAVSVNANYKNKSSYPKTLIVTPNGRYTFMLTFGDIDLDFILLNRIVDTVKIIE